MELQMTIRIKGESIRFKGAARDATFNLLFFFRRDKSWSTGWQTLALLSLVNYVSIASSIIIPFVLESLDHLNEKTRRGIKE